MKPDSTRAAIVEAIRKAGASWVDTEGRAGTPDGVWGFRGRCGFAEIKREGKKNGVCGCTHSDLATCGIRSGYDCHCKGHTEPKGERLVWHRQLAFREAWKGPPVAVWTTPEEALRTIGAIE